jgi:glycosyl transferase-like sugar-binding protein
VERKPRVTPVIASVFDADDVNRTIQGLWIGSELSAMERLSISSFLAHGHQYHLYVYGDVKYVPAETVIHDANDILPESEIFEYKHWGSYAGFSNWFRYELLLQRGGWWVDLDVVCLRPFAFHAEYVIGSEPTAEGGTCPSSGILKAPLKSELMTYLSHVCRSKDRETITWGETGPRLVADGVKRFSQEKYLQHGDVFCPFGWYQWDLALDPEVSLSLDERTCAIHLWNEMWRRNGKEKNAHYHPACLYEKLKAQFL